MTTAGKLFRKITDFACRVIFFSALAVAALSAAPAAAVEYFVGPAGSDSADGLGPETAFATIGKGVSVLGAGDTLTVMPGDYHEAVSLRLQGEPGAPVTIRAARPGTALMRGDVDLSGFRRTPGTRYTWQVDFERPVQGVADRAGMRLYEPALTVEAVERTLGSFYQDREAGILYVHAADSSDPAGRALSASVTASDGFRLLGGSRDVVIEGLAFTGYNSLEYPEGAGGYAYWGLIARSGCERITVRDCTSFLNMGGIYLEGASDSLVEGCYAFANLNRFSELGNNIMAWSPSEVTFRGNTARNFWSPQADQSLTFYGGARGDGKPTGGVMEGNLAINTGIMIKGAFPAETTVQERNIALGVQAHYYLAPDESNLMITDPSGEESSRHYADPVNHDFRLQSDSALRGTGPGGSDPGPFPYRDEVFFVSPGGDDTNPGTSLALAWRTLGHAARLTGPGDTVYVTGGVYRETLAPAYSGEPGRPVSFRRRGLERVVLDGGGESETGIDLAGLSHVKVSGFVVRDFTGPGVRVSGGRGISLSHLVVEDCLLPVAVSGSADLSLEHCLLREPAPRGFLARLFRPRPAAPGLRLENSPGAFLTGNVFDVPGGPAIEADEASLEGLYSDLNAFARGASPASVHGRDAYRTLEAWRAAAGHDRRSISADPGYRDRRGGDYSPGAGSPLIGRGPLGHPVGPYRPVPVLEPSPVEHLAVRALTATTATIECWTPRAATGLVLEWGESDLVMEPGLPDSEWHELETPRFLDGMPYRPAIFYSVGLSGLEPGTEYRVSARAAGAPGTARPEGVVQYYYRSTDPGIVAGWRWAPHEADGEGAAAPRATLSFRTRTRDLPGRVFHVSKEGNDAAGGLSEDDAWRTISHAAGQVRAGDTVLVHSGTWQEQVIIPASGDAHAPITFRAAPGATAWLDGAGRTNPTAFRLVENHHVHIDGFYFRDFRNISHGGGPVSIEGGSNIVVRRCFHDGRERAGYMPLFIRASNTAGLLVENCVIISGMGQGIILARCHDATIRHNVFYNQLIDPFQAVHWRREYDPEMVVTLSHNLICDSQPEKNAPLVYFSHLDALRSDHNGYFTRFGPGERFVLHASWYRGEPLGELREGAAWPSGRRFLLSELQEFTGQEIGSVFGNPGFRVTAQLVPQGRRTAEYWRDEMHWDAESGAFLPLDFSDFFADPAGPMGRSAAGRPIGLDPAAFE